MKHQPPLLENSFYHIYNRGNNGDNVFYTNENYRYFLSRYDYYLSDYLETYAYCLLPNHFHLLVRVKPYSNFPKGSNTIPERDGIAAPELAASEQFRRLFLGYAQAINKQEGRTGSLFQKNFQRKEVSNPHYFSRLVYYIHANPQLHGVCNDFKEYAHSSYGRILTDRPSKLFKHEVLEWFGSKQSYVEFHTTQHDYKGISAVIIEE